MTLRTRNIKLGKIRQVRLCIGFQLVFQTKGIAEALEARQPRCRLVLVYLYGRTVVVRISRHIGDYIKRAPGKKQ